MPNKNDRRPLPRDGDHDTSNASISIAQPGGKAGGA